MVCVGTKIQICMTSVGETMIKENILRCQLMVTLGFLFAICTRNALKKDGAKNVKANSLPF